MLHEAVASLTPRIERLPFLDYGIADILANATKGLAIVLEHRYYGTVPSASIEIWYCDAHK